MSIKKYPKGSSQKLSEHFKAKEFDCPGKGCCSQSLVDDKLVAYLEKIRTHFGKPLVPLGYRCTKYNATVPNAAKGSYHTYGQAADFHIDGVACTEIAKYAESIGVLGIGLYDTFVHIDTRATKSFWYGHGGEKRTTFGGAPAVQEQKADYTLGMRNLKKGCKGQDVKALQILLKGLGYNGNMGTPDGTFGPNTEGAVKLYQQKQGLPVTGIAAEKTWKKLLGV